MTCVPFLSDADVFCSLAQGNTWLDFEERERCIGKAGDKRGRAQIAALMAEIQPLGGLLNFAALCHALIISQLL